MNMTEFIEAVGEGRADLLLKNCQLIDVLSGRIRPSSISIYRDMVVGLDGASEAKETMDMGGRFVAPGFMDAHVHFESSMVPLSEFAKTVLLHGTTAIFTDCHEIANVKGVEGIRYAISCSRYLPLDIFVMLPSCVPATPLETSGAVLEARDLEPLLEEPEVIGLGELMNFPGTINRDAGVLSKLELVRGLPVDGHAPGLSGNALSAYVIAGPDSDHECTLEEEAEEKLEKGMFIFLREGTATKNLKDLLPVVNPENSSRFCLCTDDRSPFDLLNIGHIEPLVRETMEFGIPPVTAFQMSSMNTARRFGLPRRGAIAPGYLADLVIMDNLEDLRVGMVFKNGKLVAEEGRLTVDIEESTKSLSSSFNVKGFSIERLRVPNRGVAKVIEVIPDQIITHSFRAALLDENGLAVSDTERDILKVAVVERHRGTGNVGLGFVKGFGIKKGAFASSVSHDSHNIVVVGTSDSDMVAAVERVIEMKGGQVVVNGGEVVAELALPIAGLMSELSTQATASKHEGLKEAARSIGCVLPDPFFTMSFLALPVIPELKITDKGLVDVEMFDIVGLFD
ncbi:MAG: adenine deaminase [Actinomycetota bacterium]|nr:adenine deaminase [Actinomycetota bacterium]